MNLKEIKEKAAIEFALNKFPETWVNAGDSGLKTDVNYSRRLHAEEVYLLGFAKAIEILSECGEFEIINLEFVHQIETIEAKIIGDYKGIPDGKFIKIEALAAANLKISQLESDLKMKAENGCCIVEHGWRMDAEHKLKDTEKKISQLEEALAQEEKDCLRVIEERDHWESRIDDIAHHLGDEREWTSHNDRSENCIEGIHNLQEKIQQLESENEVLKAKVDKAVEQRNIENFERLNLIYRDGVQNNLSFEQRQEMDAELNAITKESLK